MIRRYFVQDELVGFARQVHEHPTAEVFGLPAARTITKHTSPGFSCCDRTSNTSGSQRCSIRLASRRIAPRPLGRRLLYGSEDADGEDSYVLCEINVPAALSSYHLNS